VKKIEAIMALTAGEFDKIKSGTSTFIFLDDSVVNMKSKKPIDMKNIHEDGWEGLLEPKWYDDIPETGYICWISEEIGNKFDVTIITKHEDGVFSNVSNDGWPWAEPVTAEEAKDLMFAGLGKKKSPKKAAAAKKVEEISSEEDVKQYSVEAEDIEIEENKDSAPTDSEIDGSDEGSSDDGVEIIPLEEPAGKPEGSQLPSTKNTAQKKGVVTDGVPTLVAQNRQYFINLGVPDELWHEFWQTLNLNSANIVELMEKGDAFCKNQVAGFMKSKQNPVADDTDEEEIPF